MPSSRKTLVPAAIADTTARFMETEPDLAEAARSIISGESGEAVLAHAAGTSQSDDLTALVIKKL